VSTLRGRDWSAVGLLLPQFDQLPPRRHPAGDLEVVLCACRLAPLTACCEIGGECIVQLPGQHAAPVLGRVDGAEHGDEGGGRVGGSVSSQKPEIDELSKV